ncbi:MAG TPA: hypothetical protein VFX98_13555, partial [Longimicrobiaceae bacterium]|nr:hypothetical protein [Longimicrobiaceae bacterium]
MSDAAPRATELRTLHFDLSHLEQEHEFTLHACLKQHPLRRHTAESLVRARRTHPFLRWVPDRHVTHFIEDVALPADAVALLHVTRPVEVDGNVAEQLATMSIHIPHEGRRRVRERARGSGWDNWALHPKLTRFRTFAAADGLPAGDYPVDPQFP